MLEFRNLIQLLLWLVLVGMQNIRYLVFLGHLTAITHFLLYVATISRAVHRHQVKKSFGIFNFLLFPNDIRFPFKLARPTIANFYRYLPLVSSFDFLGLCLLELFFSDLNQNFEWLEHVLFIFKHLIGFPDGVQVSLPVFILAQPPQNPRIRLAQLAILRKWHDYMPNILVHLFLRSEQMSLPYQHA